MDKSITFSVLMLLINAAAHCRIFHIISSTDDHCESTREPCLTLQQFVTNATFLSSDNITLELYQGNHYLRSQFSPTNINTFILTSTIGHGASVVCNHSSYFSFNQMRHMNIIGVTLIDCQINLNHVTNATFARNRFLNSNGCCNAIIVARQAFVWVYNSTLVSQNYSGRAIYLYNGNVSILNSSVSGYSGSYGGAIYAQRVPVIEIFNSFFSDNAATPIGYGGAIYIQNGMNITISKSHFVGNRVLSGYYGGSAVSITGEIVSITDSYFGNNRAVADSSGAVDIIRGGVTEIARCYFQNNEAGSTGSAVYFYEGILTISNSCFSNNTGGSHGGAIFVYFASIVTITGCYFGGNTATGRGYGGGALYTYQGTLSIINSYFINNTAGGPGGAIYVSTGVIFTTTGCYFGGNTVIERGYGGGAVYTYQGTSSIINSYFINNTAGGRGGAIYVRMGPGAIVTNSVFIRNAAGYRGAAIYATGGQVVNISSCYFCDSRGVYVYTNADYNIITNTTFINRSEVGGGAINSATLTQVNNTYIDNATITCKNVNNEAMLFYCHANLSASGNTNSTAIDTPSLAVTEVARTALIPPLMDTTTTESYNRSTTVSSSVTTAERNIATENGVTAAGSFEVLPPPLNLHLASASPQLLMFNWDHPLSNCYTYEYGVEATNCGVCPNATLSTTCTCTNININDDMCTFSVFITACGDNLRVLGRATSVSFLLQVPEPPVMKVIPYYSYESKYLSALEVTFEDTQFNNTALGHVSPINSYTVVYAISSIICGRFTIPVRELACFGGVCVHTFQVSSSSCSMDGDINVTISAIATNVFGDGLPSTPVTIGAANSDVEVKIDIPSLSVACIFMDYHKHQKKSVAKVCGIEYALDANCENLTYSSQNYQNSSSSTVTIELLAYPGFYNEISHCFTVTARNGDLTTKITGMFYTSCSSSDLSDGTTLPDDVKCDTPLNSLGIKDGVVCYRNTAIGATATYSCLKCGQNHISVRTCLTNGSWNGSIPRCNYGTNDYAILSAAYASTVDVKYFAITLPHAVITLTVIIALIIMIRVQIKHKQKNSKLTKNHNSTRDSTIYDEIHYTIPSGLPSTSASTKEDITYDVVMEVA